MTCSTIQDNLFEYLLRFPSYKYVLTADIEKRYPQKLVHPDDRKFQQILWYNENQIRVYQLNTDSYVYRLIHSYLFEQSENLQKMMENIFQ